MLSSNNSPQPVVEEYQKLAPRYDARWRRYLHATTEATLARLPPSTADVLDVGCGTGLLLERLFRERPSAKLTGVDASTAMLDVARDRLPTEVTLVEGNAEALPFADRSFDVVTSSSVLHYLREPSRGLEEMLRVLRPQGMLIVTDWCGDYLSMKLFDLYLRLRDAAHHRTLRSQSLRQLLDRAGAASIEIETYKITMLWGLMTATGQKQAAHSPNV